MALSVERAYKHCGQSKTVCLLSSLSFLITYFLETIFPFFMHFPFYLLFILTFTRVLSRFLYFFLPRLFIFIWNCKISCRAARPIFCCFWFPIYLLLIYKIYDILSSLFVFILAGILFLYICGVQNSNNGVCEIATKNGFYTQHKNIHS